MQTFYEHLFCGVEHLWRLLLSFQHSATIATKDVLTGYGKVHNVDK